MMEEITKRLLEYCNNHPNKMSEAFNLIDYTLRTYGDEHHDNRYWYNKAISNEDAKITGSIVTWTDFAYIMGGE